MTNVSFTVSSHLYSVFRDESLPLVNEVFMFLCKVRQGFLEQDLATRFNVSHSIVSPILITWVNYLYVMLGSLPIWWSCAAVQIDMPQCFQQTYPNKNVFSRIDKIYFMNASALAMKYGTRRAKLAGSTLCVSLFRLLASSLCHVVSITSFNLNPPTFAAKLYYNLDCT